MFNFEAYRAESTKCRKTSSECSQDTGTGIVRCGERAMSNVTAREDPIGEKIAGLWQHGYSCGQILMCLGLENQGKRNWDVVRCVEGLKGGFEFSRGICGALSCMPAGSVR